MNPESVKRREYTGIFLLLAGILLSGYGLLGLLFDWPTALGSLGTGAGALALATAILTTIPKLVQDLDEA